MQKRILFSCCLFLSILILNSCGPELKVTGSWINKDKLGGKPYGSVFIIVLTPNLDTRTILENQLAAGATAHGVKAVKSLEVFGPVTANGDTMVLKALIKKVTESGCKTVMTVALVDSKSETKYHEASSSTYQPYSYGPYGNYGYGNFSNYYGYAFSTGGYYSPGYYTTDNTYYIETNLYEVSTQDILFSIQTKAVNPDDIEKSSEHFTVKLLEELKSNGLLKQ
jgi:hypothetical protein